MAHDYKPSAQKSSAKSGKKTAGSRKKTASKKRAGKANATPNTAEKAPEKKPPRLLQAALIALIVAFVYGIYQLSRIEADPSTESPKSAETKEKKAAQKVEIPTYQFYDTLPKNKVTTATDGPYEYVPRDSKQDFYYLVQAGSFRTFADADRQKAQLALQGLKSSIQETRSKSGNTWFRINVGPYEQRSEMNQALDKLVALNIKPLVRKIKK